MFSAWAFRILKEKYLMCEHKVQITEPKIEWITKRFSSDIL
jgi:hypothetical protein